MDFTIKNTTLLKKILWLDVFMGGITSIIGLTLFKPLTSVLGLPENLILVIAIVTLCYAIFAFILVRQRPVPIHLLRILVKANWLWTYVSVGLFFMYYNVAEILGIIFLILQILVVGGLAYLEENQISKT